MKKLSILAGTTLLCAFPVSLQPSQDKLSVSLDTASARVGRPLTPVSVAGVARRTDRRAYRRGAVYGTGPYYGAGSYYGTERRAYRRGAVAAGAAIGAGPYYGTGPNYGAGSYYGSGAVAAGAIGAGPYYGTGPNYGAGSYYGSGAVAAGAIGAGPYYGTGPNYGAGSYYGSGAYLGAANASANYGDRDIYMLRVPISEAEAVRYCAQTFRSYDIGSRTFLASSGQRVSCPQ